MLGRILETTSEVVKSDDAEEYEAETTVFRTLGVFDSITVWGHEQVPGTSAGDGVLRGVEEWIGFAEKINSWEEEEVEKK